MKQSGKKKRRKRRHLFFASFLLLILALLGLWKEHTEHDYDSEEVICTPNSIISWEERIRQEYWYKYEDRLSDLQNGDILLTPCSHTFGWRNGHAAIVIDAEQGLTLESVVLGTPSTVQSVDKWRKYPGVMVLRLKEAAEEERCAIADYAAREMLDVNYGFWGEFAEHIFEEEPQDTHCAHLIWTVYRAFGYDIDGDGGIVVTPKDISSSSLLEVVESYNVDNW